MVPLYCATPPGDASQQAALKLMKQKPERPRAELLSAWPLDSLAAVKFGGGANESGRFSLPQAYCAWTLTLASAICVSLRSVSLSSSNVFSSRRAASW